MNDALEAFERVLNDYNHGIYGNRTVKDSETDIETVRQALQQASVPSSGGKLRSATYWRTRYRLVKAKMEKKSQADKWRPTHIHVRTGGEYQKIEDASLQTDKPLHDECNLVIYRGDNGRLWARPPTEFNDVERFKPLPEPPKEG